MSNNLFIKQSTSYEIVMTSKSWEHCDDRYRMMEYACNTGFHTLPFFVQICKDNWEQLNGACRKIILNRIKRPVDTFSYAAQSYQLDDAKDLNYLGWLIGSSPTLIDLDLIFKIFDNYKVDTCNRLRCTSSFDGMAFTKVNHPATFSSWKDYSIPRLAQQIKEEKCYDSMPILADMLEEAGCTDEQVINHCRIPKSHYTNCWVVKWLSL